MAAAPAPARPGGAPRSNGASKPVCSGAAAAQARPGGHAVTVTVPVTRAGATLMAAASAAMPVVRAGPARAPGGGAMENDQLETIHVSSWCGPSPSQMWRSVPVTVRLPLPAAAVQLGT